MYSTRLVCIFNTPDCDMPHIYPVHIRDLLCSSEACHICIQHALFVYSTRLIVTCLIYAAFTSVTCFVLLRHATNVFNTLHLYI